MITTSEVSAKRERNNSADKAQISKNGTKIIRLPITMEAHEASIEDRKNYVTFLDFYIKKYPELFPVEIDKGFGVHDCKHSAKVDFSYFRIKIKSTKAVYSVVPCDVLPYMRGTVKEACWGLLLIMYGVPTWLIVKCLGRNIDFWHGLFQSFGHCSIVGTTVKTKANMPENITIDEKITWWNGQEIYAAMVAGAGCILGNALSKTEDEAGLKGAYARFKEEVLNILPKYSPKSCCIDGWTSSRKAMMALFPSLILIRCFLHSILKIRAVYKKEPFKNTLMDKAWTVYKSKNIKELADNIVNLETWTAQNVQKDSVKQNVAKLCGRKAEFATTFDAPEGHRTTSMVDRAMRPFEKFLTNRMYFHGHFATAEHTCTAFAICHNFAPFAPRTRQFNKEHANCRADELNGFAYRENWLENLLVATSRNGFA
jgi:hypothetical protein